VQTQTCDVRQNYLFSMRRAYLPYPLSLQQILNYLSTKKPFLYNKNNHFQIFSYTCIFIFHWMHQGEKKKKAALMISKQTNYLIHNTSPLDMPLSNTLIYIFE